MQTTDAADLAMQDDQGKIRLSCRWQPAKNATFSHDGYYEKVDRTAAGLELDLCPAAICFAERMPE